ncbi:ADP-ribosylation factor-like protein 6-interacting protein 1 [Haliotis asinina]|uniref:ADP-ribosylation factor-like protein 6-interacting protein 1 n=1 Tax=Haliotis asinina TaxID=109174 RepID=UPI0035319103
MADSTESRPQEDSPRSSPHNELEELKKDLEGWREVLLPMTRLLNWDKPYHPAVILGVSTFIFALIWYFEPSVLTTFSLFGLIISLIDFLVPIVGPTLFASGSWTVVQQQQYEQICLRLMHARDHFINFKNAMGTLKVEKPKVYFILVMGILVVFAWVGSLFDNLFLTYFLLNIILLVPGLRRHGIIQKYFRGVWLVIKRLIMGKDKKN